MAGAGTMGSGIAICAAQHGFSVILLDNNEKVVDNARKSIEKNLDALLLKGKIDEAGLKSIIQRIHFTSTITDAKADLIIEAIIEKAAPKIELFNQLALINSPETIFASNTSSLSIDLLQSAIAHPERVVGMHFFNPAQIMKLVEVVQAKDTAGQVVNKIVDVCKKMQKTPVVCKDAPGFIVNRVARHYYLEAMRCVVDGLAKFEDVDAIMEASGFKMGPFKLMDMIGMDINLAVSQSLYDAFSHEPRFQPSPLQIDKVKNGELGRKTGKGFYAYTANG